MTWFQEFTLFKRTNNWKFYLIYLYNNAYEARHDWGSLWCNMPTFANIIMQHNVRWCKFHAYDGNIEQVGETKEQP